MNNVMFSSKSDEWSTPKEVFDLLDQEFNFNLDPCANTDNHKCDKYFTIEDDGLSMSWGGTRRFAIHHTVKLHDGLKRLLMKVTKITPLLSF